MAKRIETEPVTLLESPFRRHTFYNPRRTIMNLRNLAIAAIVVSGIAVGAGAFGGKFAWLSNAWAQTDGPTAQGNTLAVTTDATNIAPPKVPCKGLEGDGLYAENDCKVLLASQAKDLADKKAAALVQPPAKPVLAQASAPSTTPTRVQPEPAQAVAPSTDYSYTPAPLADDPKAKALEEFVKAAREFKLAVSNAEKAKLAIDTATDKNAAKANYQRLGGIAATAGTKANAAKATAMAAGATPQEIVAADAVASAPPVIASPTPAPQPIQAVTASVAPPPEMASGPKAQRPGAVIFRAPQPTPDQVRCELFKHGNPVRYYYDEISEDSPDTAATGWCSPEMLGASISPVHLQAMGVRLLAARTKP